MDHHSTSSRRMRTPGRLSRRAFTIGLGLAAAPWRTRAAFQSATPAAAPAAADSERVVAAVSHLDELAAQTMERTGIPGLAIAVVSGDDAVAVRGYGTIEPGGDAPVTPDTTYQLASVSKPIASTVVAMLVGDGVVAWDDPVVRLDPGFALSDPWITSQTTIRDLMCHRSGLPAFAGDLLEDIGYSRAEILRRLRYVLPGSPFRTQYAYTNFGYTEGVLAAAEVIGQRWEALATQRLFRPLGMTDTSARHDALPQHGRAAPLLVREGDAWVASGGRNADAQSPAGGIHSTAHDLAQWLRLQLNQGAFGGMQIVAAAALAETHRPQIVSAAPPDPRTDHAGLYGLGWNVGYEADGSVRLSHSGAFNLGAATTVALLPGQRVGIAVLTNTSPVGAPESIAASFTDYVLFGRVTQDWATRYEEAFSAPVAAAAAARFDYAAPPANPSPALPDEAYVGMYDSLLFGPLAVTATNGGLEIALGPAPLKLPLAHYD
ncbi:MAG: beta-lactamase family protein, partial [Thermomicrobiales bacterium]|nr:beta-lactamase family protein [Thermomicrobiales bacterium]